MPKCPLCTTDPKNPVFHRSMRQCPKRSNVRVKAPASVGVSGPAPGPPAAAGARPIDETKPTVASEVLPPGSQPSAQPKKKGILTFLRKETSKISDEVSKPKEEFDWVLPEEANARLWTSALAFARQCLNLFNRFVGLPSLPPELLSFGKSDIDSINECFRRPTSKLLYSMGFRTVESATRFTLAFAGFSIFGLMVVQLGLWYAEQIPKSAKIIAWRAKQREKAISVRERLNAERQAKGGGTPQLTAGAPAA